MLDAPLFLIFYLICAVACCFLLILPPPRSSGQVDSPLAQNKNSPTTSSFSPLIFIHASSSSWHFFLRHATLPYASSIPQSYLLKHKAQRGWTTSSNVVSDKLKMWTKVCSAAKPTLASTPCLDTWVPVPFPPCMRLAACSSWELRRADRSK